LACDDGAPRKIQIDENDIYLAKQYLKSECIYIKFLINKKIKIKKLKKKQKKIKQLNIIN
jgi:hypothetical protein